MATEVPAHITGTIWKIEKRVGDSVTAGEAILIIESMKMEMPVEAPSAGTVRELRCKETEAVQEGQILAVLDP